MKRHLAKKATDEAIERYPSDINKQIDFERELQEKYKDELAASYGFTRDQLQSIIVEGITNRWKYLSSADRDSAAQQTEPTRPTDVIVRVRVWDKTQNNPLHDKAEIWFRGNGSWWLKEETKFGSATKNLGRRKVGVKFA